MILARREPMNATDLTGRLLKGERIIWSGRPGQGLVFTGRDWLLIPLSLLWCGFAIFWETTVVSTQTPVFMKLWGVPVVLIGVYLVAGRFLLDAWVRSGMQYAVTNKRILISRSGPFSKFTAVSLEQLPDATLTEDADGRGTIRFGEQSLWTNRGGRFSAWTPSLDATPQLIAIENARSVFDQIQAAIGRAAV
jgi:hypothetical protein